MTNWNAPWGINDDGDVADEGGELVAIDPRQGNFPSRLIAAAPELYEAAEKALALIAGARVRGKWPCRPSLGPTDAEASLRIALARARGDQVQS